MGGFIHAGTMWRWMDEVEDVALRRDMLEEVRGIILDSTPIAPASLRGDVAGRWGRQGGGCLRGGGAGRWGRQGEGSASGGGAGRGGRLRGLGGVFGWSSFRGHVLFSRCYLLARSVRALPPLCMPASAGYR